MAIFNTNQNRQFYVVDSYKTTTPTEEGEFSIKKTQDKKQVWFTHFGKGGLTRTDIIDVDKIAYAKLTYPAVMRRYAKIAKVSLDEDINEGKPISGQDYVLRLEVKNYLCPGDASVMIKSNAVHAVKDMTAEEFYTKMKESLERNFKRDEQYGLPKLLTFEADEDGITITEVVEQPWRLGVLSQEPVNFDVIPTTVRYDGEEVIWGKVTKDVSTTKYVGNGTKVADLEYFCMAERGDVFRNMGWPNNIDVKYMVDPSEEYYMLDIHYAYAGDGVDNQKSEKDLTMVFTDYTTFDSINAYFEDLGITIEEKKPEE